MSIDPIATPAEEVTVGQHPARLVYRNLLNSCPFTDSCAEAIKDSLRGADSFTEESLTMTINPLSHTVPTQAAPEAKVVEQKSAGSKPQPALTDTVTISSLNKATLQELTETSVQTAREARSGDVQAKRLLAREAAAKAYQQLNGSTQH